MSKCQKKLEATYENISTDAAQNALKFLKIKSKE